MKSGQIEITLAFLRYLKHRIKLYHLLNLWQFFWHHTTNKPNCKKIEYTRSMKVLLMAGNCIAFYIHMDCGFVDILRQHQPIFSWEKLNRYASDLYVIFWCAKFWSNKVALDNESLILLMHHHPFSFWLLKMIQFLRPRFFLSSTKNQYQELQKKM